MATQLHDGEQLEAMVKASGVSVKKFADLMGIGKNTPRRWFDTVNHVDARLLLAAKKLRMQVGEFFPRLVDKNPPSLPIGVPPTAEEAEAIYATESRATALVDCNRKLAEKDQEYLVLMKRYTSLLEDHNGLLREVARRSWNVQSAAQSLPNSG